MSGSAGVWRPRPLLDPCEVQASRVAVEVETDRARAHDLARRALANSGRRPDPRELLPMYLDDDVPVGEVWLGQRRQLPFPSWLRDDLLGIPPVSVPPDPRAMLRIVVG